MADFTKKAIEETFLKMLDEKPLTAITVKDLAKECNINRNSFYYHYSDLPQLVEIIVKRDIDRIIAEHPSIDSIEDSFHVAVLFIKERRRAILNIYNSVSRDIFERYLMQVCEYAVSTYFDTVFKNYNLDENDKSIIIKYTKYECFGAAIDWLETGMKNDIEEDFKRISEIKRDSVLQMIENLSK